MSNQIKCPKCEGCGKVANDEEKTPWVFWANLPVQSALAVTMGLVSPITCEHCNGTGKVEEENK